ncbi:hypothetical protein Bbelb_227580 [Branchiostoma belcheri]|nr:hypothetical protein Bbelb_227580 [Branchiostoma belcheri]
MAVHDPHGRITWNTDGRTVNNIARHHPPDTSTKLLMSSAVLAAVSSDFTAPQFPLALPNIKLVPPTQLVGVIKTPASWPINGDLTRLIEKAIYSIIEIYTDVPNSPRSSYTFYRLNYRPYPQHTFLLPPLQAPGMLQCNGSVWTLPPVTKLLDGSVQSILSSPVPAARSFIVLTMEQLGPASACR